MIPNLTTNPNLTTDPNLTLTLYPNQCRDEGLSGWWCVSLPLNLTLTKPKEPYLLILELKGVTEKTSHRPPGWTHPTAKRSWCLKTPNRPQQNRPNKRESQYKEEYPEGGPGGGPDLDPRAERDDRPIRRSHRSAQRNGRTTTKKDQGRKHRKIGQRPPPNTLH